MAGEQDSNDDAWGSGVFLSGAPDMSPALVGRESQGAAPDPDHPFRTPDRERYQEGALLGWGGMGEVSAVRDRRLNREVACKRIPVAAIADSQRAARLAREAWITAHLEHPGIVPVYDAGISADGHLFYTMRLIRGRTLAAVLAEAHGLDGRLALLRHVLGACEAIAYAHSVGVVHRDLKPTNVMVGEFGETQVVDWGLAIVPDPADQEQWRALGLPDAPGGEVAGVGTPAYMGPEQARGEPVDARADVWSLGAIIYELLTAAPPHLASDAETVLARAKAGVAPPLLERNPHVPPELAAIVERALAPEPADRYPSARELARELARWFEGRRVQAYHYTAWDELKRFVSTWRAPLVTAAVALMVLTALGAWGWDQTRRERNRAVAAETSALTALHRADDQLALALVEKAWAAAEDGARPEAELLAVHSLALRPSPEARGVLASFASQPRMRKLSDVALPHCDEIVLDHDGGSFACLHVDSVAVWDVGESRAVRRWSVELPSVWSVLLQPGSDRVGVLAGDAMHFLDARTGASVAPPVPMEGEGPFQVSTGGGAPLGGRASDLYSVDLEAGTTETYEDSCGSHVLAAGAVRHPDGVRAVIACTDGKLLRWNGEAEPPPLIQTSFLDAHTASTVAWMPDGEHVVLGSLRGGVGIVNTTTGEKARMSVGSGGHVRALAPSPDGAWVAVVAERTGVQLWDPDTGTFVGRLPASAHRAARWQDAWTLVTLGDSRLERWRVPREAGPVRYDIGVGLAAAEPSPDGQYIAIARPDAAVEVRDVATGSVVLFDGKAGERQTCKRLTWAADGSRLYAGCQDSTMRVFSMPEGARLTTTLPGFHRRVGLLQGGLMWILTYTAGGPQLYRLPDETALPPLTSGMFIDGDEDAERQVAALLGRDGGVHLLRSAPEASLTRILTEPLAGTVAVAREGERIALTRRDDVVVRDRDGTEVVVIPHAETLPVDVELTADGSRLITAGRDGVARVYDLPSGTLVARLKGHDERLSTIALADHGQTVYTASWDGSVHRFRLDVLDASPDALLTEVQAAWDRSLEDALSAPLR